MSFGPQKWKSLFAGSEESELFKNFLAEATNHTVRARNFHACQFLIGRADLKSHRESLLPCVVCPPLQGQNWLRDVQRRFKVGGWAKTQRGPLIGTAPKSAVKDLSVLAFETPMFRR
jgi:hypothetical protein